MQGTLFAMAGQQDDPHRNDVHAGLAHRRNTHLNPSENQRSTTLFLYTREKVRPNHLSFRPVMVFLIFAVKIQSLITSQTQKKL